MLKKILTLAILLQPSPFLCGSTLLVGLEFDILNLHHIPKKMIKKLKNKIKIFKHSILKL